MAVNGWAITFGTARGNWAGPQPARPFLGVPNNVTAHPLTASVLITVLLYNDPLMGTLKPQSNGLLYSNTVNGTLAVDGWAVRSGTTRRGLGELRSRPAPSSLYQL